VRPTDAETGDHAGRRHHHALAEDHAKRPAGRGAQRAPDRELAPPFGNRARHRRREADKRNRECENREADGWKHAEPAVRDRIQNVVLERTDLGNRQRGIDLADDTSQRRRD
jgi:hypothetical protein